MDNKNYKRAKYSVELSLDKSPGDVFNDVINLTKWWPEDFVGENIKMNTEFVFRTGDTHYSKNKVIEFVADKQVVWITTESIRKTDGFDWTGSKMTFELTRKGGGTVIKYTYDGLVLENESERLVQICDMTIKDMLFNFITSGKGNGFSTDNSYTASIEVAKSSGEVFKCFTSDIAKWWGGKDLKGQSTALNDEFVVHHPGSHYSKQKLVEIVPGKKVVWLVTESRMDWIQKDKNEWTNTRMIFDITSTGNASVLHFIHEGLVPGKECYEKCSQGWSIVIKDWLFHYITEGKAADFNIK